MKKVLASCPYCGVGCRLCYIIQNGKVIKVEGDPSDPVSEGRPCIKGLTAYQFIDKERIISPQIKEVGGFRNCDWEEAFEKIAKKIKDLKPENFGFVGSGELSNEDNFVFSKFARLVARSNNIDCCARTCHAATTVAMRKLFGNPAMPNFIDDLGRADVILAIGTNPAGNYPIAFNRVRAAKARGDLKLIAIDITSSATLEAADLGVVINHQGITAFVGGLCRLLIEEKVYDPACDGREGFEEFKESLEPYTIENVIKISGITRETYLGIFDLVKNAKQFVTMHGMGVTQQINGVENVIAILSLAQLKKGMIIPLRGKINVQGAGDMGTCPDWVPFGGSTSKTKEIWGEILQDAPGHRMSEFLYSNDLKVLFVLGGNIAQSLPELDTLHKNLERVFVVYINHHPSKTMEFANVILPCTVLVESEGTITNGERRVRYTRPVVKACENVLPAWKIVANLAAYLGQEEKFKYNDAGDVFNEITKAIPAYGGLSWEKTKSNDNIFADKSKFFEKFIPLKNTPLSPPPKDFPYLLTTQRSPFHFCTGEQTRRSEGLVKLHGKAECLISEKDALSLGVKNGDFVRLTSPVGNIEISVKILKKATPGIFSVPFHFQDVLVNKLFGHELDPISGEPNLKACWVRAEKI